MENQTFINTNFIISHEFSAPIEKVFEYWVHPTLITKWLGPENAEMEFLIRNVQVGKTSLWKMDTGNDRIKFGQMHYKTIEPNRLLVYVQNFCDGQGNFSKAPFSDTYPDALLTTVTFLTNRNLQTEVRVEWEIHGAATEEEIQTFISFHPSMHKGWYDSFVKLERLVS